MIPSEGPSLSASNDKLDRPLTRMALANLVRFMREHPEIELFVTDRRATGGVAAAGDGKLLIGPEDTIQAQIGRDRLGIIFYEERFQLTPESIAAIRKIVAEQAAQVMDREEPEPRIDLSYRDGRGNAIESQGARRKLEDALGAAIERVAPRMNPENNSLSIECGFPTVENCLRMARAAGFTIMEYPHPEGGKRTIHGIMGDPIRFFLNVILIRHGFTKQVTRLRETDRHNIGTYALFFDRHNGALMIRNRTAAMAI